MVGVTVDTAILAGIIKAEINACHAAAFQTLVFVFDCIDRTAKQSGNEFSVNTVGMCNLPAGQIDVFGAGVYFQPAGMSRRSKRFCDGFFLYRRQFVEVFLFCCACNIPVQVDETDGDFVCVAAQFAGYIVELFGVPAYRIPVV